MPETSDLLKKLYQERVVLATKMMTASMKGQTDEVLDLALSNILVCNEVITAMEGVIQSMWKQVHENATEARRRSS